MKLLACQKPRSAWEQWQDVKAKVRQEQFLDKIKFRGNSLDGALQATREACMVFLQRYETKVLRSRGDRLPSDVLAAALTVFDLPFWLNVTGLFGSRAASSSFRFLCSYHATICQSIFEVVTEHLRFKARWLTSTSFVTQAPCSCGRRRHCRRSWKRLGRYSQCGAICEWGTSKMQGCLEIGKICCSSTFVSSLTAKKC